MGKYAMCKYKECIKSNKCLRFLDEPVENQAYMLFQNVCNENNNYQWFWKIETQIAVREEAMGDSGEKKNKTDQATEI